MMVDILVVVLSTDVDLIYYSSPPLGRPPCGSHRCGLRLHEGWSFIRGRKQCKPKHVSCGIVVLNVMWSLIRVVSQEGDYCIYGRNAGCCRNWIVFPDSLLQTSCSKVFFFFSANNCFIQLVFVKIHLT